MDKKMCDFCTNEIKSHGSKWGFVDEIEECGYLDVCMQCDELFVYARDKELIKKIK